MKTYYLVVWCSRGGMSRDAGTHRRGEFASDQDAINGLMDKAKWLLNFYDEVECKICTDEQNPNATVVHKEVLRRHGYRESSNGYLHQVFM